MDIDYNKLKSFLVVVQCGSVTAAAKILNRTQSAISQSLQGLEQNLGFKLIEWEKKRLKLTREGQLIYKAVGARLSAIDEQLETIIKAGAEVGGSIEVGLLQDQSSNIQDVFFKKVANFRKKYPAVTFKIHFATSYEIEQALLDQEIDIGLLINFRERHRFNVFEVASEEHIIVGSSEYLKQRGPLANLKEVIAADLIDIDELFTCLTPWIRKHDPRLIQKLDERRPVITVPDFRACRELILLGQGIGVVPRYLVKNDIVSGKLVQVLPNISTLRVGVDCAVIRGRRERLCENLFIEALQKIL